MNEVDQQPMHDWLVQAASEFSYPPTPDIAARVGVRLARRSPRRQLRLQFSWALLAIVLAMGLLLMVPPVRASVLRILKAGGITIFVPEPPPAATAPARHPSTALPEATGALTTSTIPATPAPATMDETVPLLLPATRTSLEAAGAAFGRSIRLPAFPPELGAPDRVFVDNGDGAQVVILAWWGSGSGEPRYTLYEIAATNFAYKRAEAVDLTTVNGEEAFWIEGPHGFALRGGEMWDWDLTAGPILIWTEGDVTYRLEGATSLDDARQIAESVK
ncbi:MAG TPA: hypothetical protein VE553_08955 [Candidatus Binatia bacterium]|jgi:hypothetical protein|nr:hypothetical protein [Candidatus Binatia bacterium]